MKARMILSYITIVPLGCTTLSHIKKIGVSSYRLIDINEVLTYVVVVKIESMYTICNRFKSREHVYDIYVTGLNHDFSFVVCINYSVPL